MLLRSSSTPILGSLLSFSESPNNFDHAKPFPSSDASKKISFHPILSHYHLVSCNSSPVSDRDPNGGAKVFRRAQSAGNLEGLTTLDVDEFRASNPLRSSRRPASMLQTIPSFSVYNMRGEEEEEEEEDDYEYEEESVGGSDGLARSVTIGENIESVGGDFSFASGKELTLVEEVLGEGSEELLSMSGIGASPMFLARGLRIDVDDVGSALSNGGGGGGGGFLPPDLNGGGADESDVENYYKRMMEENPFNPLFVGNYAQFLHKTKKDFERAEEYYSRAILAAPGDGEILSLYANLIWEYHRDQERAASYFKQSVNASPDDSHVLAAYASFLWETEDEDDGGGEEENQSIFIGVPSSHATMASGFVWFSEDRSLRVFLVLLEK